MVMMGIPHIADIDQKVVEAIYHYNPSNLQNPLKVLELGCGNGRATAKLLWASFLDVLGSHGRFDLLKGLVLHELADFAPDRIMKEKESLRTMSEIGYCECKFVYRRTLTPCFLAMSDEPPSARGAGRAILPSGAAGVLHGFGDRPRLPPHAAATAFVVEEVQEPLVLGRLRRTRGDDP